MMRLFTIAVLLTATTASGQTNQVLCRRAVGHICGYERIFMGTNSLLTQNISTLESVTDPDFLALDEKHLALLADKSRERTNVWGSPLIQNADTDIEIVSPTNSILPDFEVGNLLRFNHAVPRDSWENSCHSDDSRDYVMTCRISNLGTVVIDLKPARFAIVFYEDDTYSFIADLSHSCKNGPMRLQGTGTATRPPPLRLVALTVEKLKRQFTEGLDMKKEPACFRKTWQSMGGEIGFSTVSLAEKTREPSLHTVHTFDVH